MDFSRSERKILRGLAGDVYEAEARQLLEELDTKFDLWRSGEMLSSELLMAVHEFHQHQSRELWSIYQGIDDTTAVARGLGLGLIAEADVPPGIRAKLDVSAWEGQR